VDKLWAQSFEGSVWRVADDRGRSKDATAGGRQLGFYDKHLGLPKVSLLKMDGGSDG